MDLPQHAATVGEYRRVPPVAAPASVLSQEDPEIDDVALILVVPVLEMDHPSMWKLSFFPNVKVGPNCEHVLEVAQAQVASTGWRQHVMHRRQDLVECMDLRDAKGVRFRPSYTTAALDEPLADMGKMTHFVEVRRIEA